MRLEQTKELLKHSQNKNDATRLKNFLGLKLPPFSITQEVFQLNRVFLAFTAL